MKHALMAHPGHAKTHAPASDTTESASHSAYLTSIWYRRSIEFKQDDAADSVVSDAGVVWRATRAAKTLHVDTAKHPRPLFRGDAGVFWWNMRAINACVPAPAT